MYTLVIVDDEQMILVGIADLFPWENIGFNVVGKFTNAREALSYLEENPVDVVMTDIKMPGMDGLSFAEKIKTDPDRIIVILSSYSDYDYMRRALKVEVTDYLLKPINYGELSECFDKIKGILDGRNKVSESDETPYYDKIIRQIDTYLEENFQ
ncbi:MAG: response regulator [Butyrivibrio sp.]|nr:response regulator [Butyrivibrio sp.]